MAINGAGTSFSHPCGIDNFEHLHIDIGNAYWSKNNMAYSLVYTSFISEAFASMASGSVTIAGLRDLSGYVFYLPLIYTKTTD